MNVLIKLVDPRTLVAGVIPVVYGTVFSFYYYDEVDIMAFLLLLLGVLLIQSCANMINDLYDHERGADGEDRAGEKALAAGDISRRKVKMIIGGFLALDLLIGIHLAVNVHIGILIVGFVGAGIMFLYSAGPRPISHTPFGEVVAGSTMGFGIICTVIFIHSGVFSIMTLLVALPSAIFIGTILLTNNISDHNEDRVNGRRTLPILIGIENAEWLWIVSCFLMLAVGMLLIFMGLFPMMNFLTVMLLFPYRDIVEFRMIEKKVMNKGQMMGKISEIGMRYHAAMVFGVIISKLFTMAK